MDEVIEKIPIEIEEANGERYQVKLDEVINRLLDDEKLSKELELLDQLGKTANELKDSTGEEVYVELPKIESIDEIPLEDVKLLTPSMIEGIKEDSSIVSKDYMDLTRLISEEAVSYDGEYSIMMETELLGLYLYYDTFMDRRTDLLFSKVIDKYQVESKKEFQKSLNKYDFYKDVVIIKPKVKLFDDLEDDIHGRSISYDLKQTIINWKPFVKKMSKKGYEIIYSHGSNKKDQMEEYIENSKQFYPPVTSIIDGDDPWENEKHIKLNWYSDNLKKKKSKRLVK